MRTAKLVKMIKEIGNNNNMVLVLNERPIVKGGVTAADQWRAANEAEAAKAPPAVGTQQRQQPGPAGGRALKQFNASVAANRAATGVVPAATGLSRGAKVLGAVGNVYSGYNDYNDRRDRGDSRLNALGGALSTAAGGIVGGLAGGAVGSAVGPVGAIAAGIGGAIGGSELASQAYDKLVGNKRDNVQPAAVAKDNSKSAADAAKRLEDSKPAAVVAAAAAGTQPGKPAPKPLQSISNTPGSRPNPITGQIDRPLPPSNPNTDAPVAGIGKTPNADAPGEEPGAQTKPAAPAPAPPPAPPPAPAAPAPPRPAAPAPAPPAPRPEAPAPPVAPAPPRPQAPPQARPEAPKQDNITRSPFGGITVNSKNSSSYDLSLEEYTRSQKRVNMRTTKLVEMIKKIGKKRIDETSRRYSRTKTHLSMAGRYNRGQQLAQEEEQIKNNPGKTMTGQRADTIEMSPEANTTKLDR